jgi:hypothetical protein
MGLRGPKPIASRILLVTTAYPIYDDLWILAKGGKRGVVREQSEKGTVITGAWLPAEPETLFALLEARTVSQVRGICRRSAYLAKQPNSYLASCLPMFAQQLLDAKRDPHYPGSVRPSSIPKKMWFLASALAGARHGLSPRRSMNLIGPGTPEEIFENIGHSPPNQSDVPVASRATRQQLL